MVKDEFGNRRFFGVYRGVIQGTSDPKGMDRLQVKIPQVLSNETTGWIWVSKFDKNQSLLFKVGQGVFVAFEGGDPSFPIILGIFGDVVNDSVIDCGVI